MKKRYTNYERNCKRNISRSISGKTREQFKVFKPLDSSSLTKEEKSGSLRVVLNLLREKCDGTLKGQTCVDGTSQRSISYES